MRELVIPTSGSVYLMARLALKFGNFTLSFGRLQQRMVQKCVVHMHHDAFPHLTNQIIVSWRCLCRYRRPCLNSLLAFQEPDRKSLSGASGVSSMFQSEVAFRSSEKRASHSSRKTLP